MQVSDSDAVVKTEGGKEEDDDPGEGKTAAFTVLLHGSLKVEGMAALIQLAYVITSSRRRVSGCE